MSVQLGKLVFHILYEHFGEAVRSVGYDLFRYGAKPVALISLSTKLPISEVKYSLCVLAKHKLVTFEPSRNPEYAEYQLLKENVLLFIRYPRYVCLIKDKYGDETEIMMDEILRMGSSTASELILKTLVRVKERYRDTECDLIALRDKFVDLVHGNYIKRCPVPLVETAVPNLFIEESHIYTIPEIDLRELAKIEHGGSGKPGDEDIHWVCNFNKFHQDIRDDLMITAMKRRIDACAGEVMRSLLQQMYVRTDAWVHTSNPIPFLELKQTCSEIAEDKFPNIISHLDQYLKIIEEDSSNFLRKIGDTSGGQYIVDIKAAMEQLAWACIENYIVERFSSKSARIFRVIRTHKHIEQELIQKRAMIPDKEAKKLTYELLENNFINIRVIRKPGSSSQGPVKSFFLFYIDLSEVVEVLLDMTHKALLNVMTRRNQTTQENLRLLQKQNRVENLVNTMKIRGDPEEHIQDIEDTITPADHETITKTKKIVDVLSLSEIKLDETLFLLNTYLFYTKKVVHTITNCKTCN